MFPIESETLYDSIKFHKFKQKIPFCDTDL